MTIGSRRWIPLAGVSLAVVGFSVACGPVSLPLVQSGGDPGNVAQPAPAAVRSTANATPTPVKTGVGTVRPVPVRRDSLTETLSLDGVVTPQEQLSLTYPQKGLVDEVLVIAGQPVKQGDVLIKLNSNEVKLSLDGARARLQASQSNLVQAQANQQSAAQRAISDQQKQQQVLVDAQARLQRALENLKTVQAGKSNSERQAQQTAVSYGQAQVQQAQAALDKLQAGPDAGAIAVAQHDVSTADIALARARADLATLTRGPDPTAVHNAESALQRAQTQLQIAQIAKPDPKVDPKLAAFQHDAAIQDAQLSVESAQAALDKLKAPPADFDVRAAKQKVQDAQDADDGAQARLAALQSGPDQSALDDAQAHLESVKHYLGEAQANYDEVMSHPTSLEMATAQEDVRNAQSALDAAQRAQPQAQDTTDIGALQAAIDASQAEVSRLEQALQDLDLRAPVDGTVVAVRVKPADTIGSTKPYMVLAKAGGQVVRVDLADTEAARLAVDQQATVQLATSASTAAPIPAVVASLTPAAQNGTAGASATLRVNWPDGQAPRFGTPIVVTVSVGQKDGVLVVPKSALHQSAGKPRVEVQDGTLRRLVTVEVGITTADSAEIVSGLTEGQIVLAGSAGSY